MAYLHDKGKEYAYDAKRLDEKHFPPVRLMFTGDILGNMSILYDALGKGENDYDFSDIFHDASLQLKKADFATGNIEGPLYVPPYTGCPDFNSPKKLAADACEAGISFFSTANNHTFDYGEEGLISTLDALDSINCLHTGTYRSKEERDLTHGVSVINVKNLRIAFLNYTYGINFKPITDEQKNLINIFNLDFDSSLRIPDSEKLESDMAYARSLTTDLIVVLMHWGCEDQNEPNDYQRKLAELLISSGANIVVGNHPHVLQPYEQIMVKGYDESIRTGLVFYSLGNFISNQEDFEERVTVIPEVILERNDKTGKVHIADVGYIPYYMYFYHNEPFGDKSAPWGHQRKLLNIHDYIKRYENGERNEIIDESLYYQLKRAIRHCHRVLGGDGDMMLRTKEKNCGNKTVFVKCEVNLYKDPEKIILGPQVKKGTQLTIIDESASLNPDKTVRLYKVTDGTNTGYIRPWYVEETENESGENEYLKIHNQREDILWGGDAGSLDYHPREKLNSERNKNIKAILINSNIKASEIEQYINLAKESNINAFVITLCDYITAGYQSEIMKRYSSLMYKKALNSRQEFTDMVKAIKRAGFYCIGRIALFWDDELCKEHPEWAITDNNGQLIKIEGGYWASPYNRSVWEYKVGLAIEAVEWFGIDEIQYDYVRFPVGIRKLVSENRINLRNEYGESRSQAIQRFLMYAADNLHEEVAFVAANVFGETAEDYVTAYGQYWPAISNVVDVISGMPYCDHYNVEGDWIPWEHPYETLNVFAKKAVMRQSECPTPAYDRTWIQCYDSIHIPKVEYGPKNVRAEIEGLIDGGMQGGFMAFNIAIEKYKDLINSGVL